MIGKENIIAPTTKNLNRLPAHVAIVPDGNGRWALQRKKPRTAGHKEGLDVAKAIVKTASEIGIRYLTLYTFSTENWQRTTDEVSFLMTLIRQHLKKEMDFYRKHKIRVLHSGRRADLPREVRRQIEEVVADTSHFMGLTVNLAINYGGRDEIVRSVNRWIAENKDNLENEGTLSERDINDFLDCPELPEADLIIRTAGEQRISNFLLWESAYAELLFSPKYWPDWTSQDLIDAVSEYQDRIRTFGGLS